MRDFEDIRRTLKLQKFLDSRLGTLYFVPSFPGAAGIIVRHFDSELPPNLVEAYVTLIKTTKEWIQRHPELDAMVKIEQPSEVGDDFVARQHHIYHTSTRSYNDWDNPPDPPKELGQMRTVLRSKLGNPATAEDAIVETVLKRSLLEPTGKTYFNETKEQFIVVEPKLVAEDVRRWHALLTQPSA